MTAEQKARLNTSGLESGRYGGIKDDASYSAIHYWVYHRKGKALKCEDCGFEGRCNWANISGEYRRDVDDFKSLCVPCHQEFDGVKVIPRNGSVKVEA